MMKIVFVKIILENKEKMRRLRDMLKTKHKELLIIKLLINKLKINT